MRQFVGLSRKILPNGGSLNENKYYTTNGSSWEETPDNAHDGVEVRWAFHLTEDEINQRAGEELFEQLLNEIELATNDKWDSDSFENIYNKFNF